MNPEVFEGCTTVDEACEAAKRERRQRFILYVDLRGDGNRLEMLSHLPEAEARGFANQMSVAINDRDGIPERLARRLEWMLNLPFGWFDQPYPERELRASLMRAKRLTRRLEREYLDKRFARSNKLKIKQIAGAVEGERGVSRELYDLVSAQLRPIRSI